MHKVINGDVPEKIFATPWANRMEAARP